MEYSEFVKEENKLLERLPLEFRSAASGLACGFARKESAEVHLLHLTAIVEALERPIKKYEARTSKEIYQDLDLKELAEIVERREKLI